MATRMQQRRGTAAQWTDADPVLAAGEIGFETDTNQFKIGDGVNVWSDLSYFQTIGDLGGTFDDYVPLSSKGNANGVATLDQNAQVPISQLQNLIDNAPSTLDTLNDIATAIGVIDGEVDTKISAAVGAESTARSQEIAQAIQDEETQRNAAIDNAIDNEVQLRDNAISAAIGQEVSDRNAAISSEIADEVTARDAAIAAAVANLAGDADAQAYASTAEQNAKDYADAELSGHNSDTTNVHGIADTSLLALKSEVAAVTAASLGLGNVDNTSDANKPVSTAQATAIANAKAEAIADATSQVNAVIASAPTALNTLDELAAALNDDANFASTVTTALDGKVASYTPISQKTGAYTLSSLTERDSLIEVNSSSAVTITIPTNSAVAYPVGTSLDILQTGSGQVTSAGAGGVTVNATPGLKLRTQWSSATLFKRAENTWVVYGDLSA